MTHTDLKPPPLRGRRAKRIAVAIAAPIVVLGLIAASPAQAFETRASKGTDNGAGGFASTFIGDDGALADCIQPGNPDPYNPGEFVAGARNITVPGNQWGGPVTLTDQQQAQINAINSLHNPGLADGSAEARAQRAAAAIVIKSIVSTQWEYNVLHSAGYNGGASDVGEMARWASYTSGAAFADRVKELANQYWAEAQSVQVGSNGVNGNPGTLTGSFEIDPNNNYDGKIKLETTGDTDGTWSVALENGKFKDTGDASGSFAANGSSTLEKPVIGVPPSPGAQYKIKANFSYTAPGKPGADGWKPLLNLTRTVDGTQWVASGTGRETSVGNPASASGSVSDPANRASVFSPEAVTKSDAKYYVSGDRPSDNIRVQLGKNADGTTNQWPRSSKGDYAPITLNGTLYGPMTKKPQQSSSIPADAKIAGTGTVTVGGNSTDPTSQSVKITSDKPLADDQEQASGYYTWVVTVDGKQQAQTVRPWLDGGEAYKYVSDFGIADESFTSPPKVQTKARTTTGISTEISGSQVPTTGLGLKVKDTITVSGVADKASGFFLVNRYYTFANTIGANGDLVAPTQPLCDASTLTYTSKQVPIDGPGEYETSMNSDHVGVGTWVTSLYSPDGKELTRGSCEDRSEWAAVKQLLVQTKASEPSNGKATDEATLWGTVPAGSQIASNLYEQIGEVTDSDKHLATAGPIGLNQGLVNGVVVTLPTVSYKTSPDADAVYFVEVVYDLDGNVIAQGKRGVESETIRLTTPTPPVTPPTGAGRNAAGNGGNGAAANVPIVSG